MNIEDYAKSLKKQHNGQSYAFLAERVPESADAPYRFAPISEPIKPNAPIIIAFGGSGDGANIIGHNWFIKHITNFIRSYPQLNGARVCVAVCDFGKKYNDNIARDAYNIQKDTPKVWNFLDKVVKHPITKMDPENYNPRAARDIFNAVILPKITDKYGFRLSTNQMLQNIRGITIIAYCSGGHTAMYLEHEMVAQMGKYGYRQNEIKTALNQIAVIGSHLTCPYDKSNMRFFNFHSVSDVGHMNSFQEFLYMSQARFDIMHIAKNNSDTFYCNRMSKDEYLNGERIIRVIPVEDFMGKMDEQNSEDHVESPTDMFGEHDFIGFVEKDDFSNGAKDLQTLFKTIIVNTAENSIKNAHGNKFVPLPATEDLVGDKLDILGRANVAFIREETIYIPSALSWQLIYQQKQIANLHSIRKWLKSR